MPAPPLDARSQTAEVISVRACGDDGAILTVRLESPLPPLRAARFFMLRRADPVSPAIPRPFSVYRQSDDGTLDFLLKVMGRGTQALVESRPGTRLVCIGPLGNGFPEFQQGAPLVMVAGGIGSAPFHMTISQGLAGSNGPALSPERITMIYGGRHGGLLYDIDAFRELGVRVLAATDDGSVGFHGNVVECLLQQWEVGDLPEDVRLLTCGPEPMMAAVARLAEKRGLECWLSFETYMGCGVGICNGCAISTRPGGVLGDWPVAKCCVDGPVFEAGAILYD